MNTYYDFSIEDYKFKVLINAYFWIFHPFPQNYITHFKPRESGTSKKKKKATSWFIFCACLLHAQSMCIVEPNYVSEYIKQLFANITNIRLCLLIDSFTHLQTELIFKDQRTFNQKYPVRKHSSKKKKKKAICNSNQKQNP